MANYGRELRMAIDIRRKGKMEKATEFEKRMKKAQEEVGAVLKRTQEEMKRQVNRRRKEVEVWKVEDKVMLSTKDLVFKKQLVKKLVDQYISPYIIDEVISTNAIKLQLPTLMIIHSVVVATTSHKDQ